MKHRTPDQSAENPEASRFEGTFRHYWQEQATQPAAEQDDSRRCLRNQATVDTLLDRMDSGTAETADLIHLYCAFGSENPMAGGAPVLTELADQLEHQQRQINPDQIVATLGEGRGQRRYIRADALNFVMSMRLDAAEVLQRDGQTEAGERQYGEAIRLYRDELEAGHPTSPEMMAYATDAVLNRALLQLSQGDETAGRWLFGESATADTPAQNSLSETFAGNARRLISRTPDSPEKKGLLTELAIHAAGVRLVSDLAAMKLEQGVRPQPGELGMRKTFKREDEPRDGLTRRQKVSCDEKLTINGKSIAIQAKKIEHLNDYDQRLEEHLGSYDSQKVDLVMLTPRESETVLRNLAEDTAGARKAGALLVGRIKRSRQMAAAQATARRDDQAVLTTR